MLVSRVSAGSVCRTREWQNMWLSCKASHPLAVLWQERSAAVLRVSTNDARQGAAQLDTEQDTCVRSPAISASMSSATA